MVKKNAVKHKTQFFRKKLLGEGPDFYYLKCHWILGINYLHQLWRI